MGVPLSWHSSHAVAKIAFPYHRDNGSTGAGFARLDVRGQSRVVFGPR